MEDELDHPDLPFLQRNYSQRRWHYVHFHDSDSDLIDNLCRFLIPAFRPGHAGVVLATAEHLTALRERAGAFGLDLEVATASGRFIGMDARAMLERIMVDGSPDRTRFHVIVQGMLKEVATEHPHLHVYGELVALLWQDGNEAGTHLLEAMWNDLGRMRPFSLLCGYPRSAFASTEQAASFNRICSAHSHVHGS